MFKWLKRKENAKLIELTGNWHKEIVRRQYAENELLDLKLENKRLKKLYKPEGFCDDCLSIKEEHDYAVRKRDKAEHKAKMYERERVERSRRMKKQFKHLDKELLKKPLDVWKLKNITAKLYKHTFETITTAPRKPHRRTI